jgi:hypothetical protein
VQDIQNTFSYALFHGSTKHRKEKMIGRREKDLSILQYFLNSKPFLPLVIFPQATEVLQKQLVRSVVAC